MRTDTTPKKPACPSGGEDERKQAPTSLTETLAWSFLPPAFAALVYGLLDVFAGMAPSTAMFMSVLFTLVLIFSPERRMSDWHGLCFITAAVGLFAIGHPASIVVGGIVALFALISVFDEEVRLDWKGRLALVAIHLFTAGLASAVYLVAVWATLAVFTVYLIFYAMIRLMPVGIIACDTCMDDDA